MQHRYVLAPQTLTCVSSLYRLRSIWLDAGIHLRLTYSISCDFAEEFASYTLSSNDHNYVLYDGGEDNPNSNADALHLIASERSIAVRSFNSTSETGSVEMTFLGHLTAVNDRAERVRKECGDYSI